MRARRIVLGVAAAVACVGVGRYLVPASTGAGPARVEARPAPERAVVVAGAGGLDRETLRAELRAALAAVATPAPSACPDGVAAAATEPAPAEATADALDAAGEAGELLASALERGRWERSDAAHLHELMPRMSDRDRIAVLDELAAAVNRGDLVPEDGRVL